MGEVREYWFTRPPMEPVVKQGSFRAYGHTIGPAQRRLEAWVAGRPLNSALLPVWEREDYDRDSKSTLKIEGHSVGGYMRWTVLFQQYGDPLSHGMCGGCGSAEDACDRALELIEEHEAEVAAEIVIGVS